MIVMSQAITASGPAAVAMSARMPARAPVPAHRAPRRCARAAARRGAPPPCPPPVGHEHGQRRERGGGIADHGQRRVGSPDSLGGGVDLNQPAGEAQLVLAGSAPSSVPTHSTTSRRKQLAKRRVVAAGTGAQRVARRERALAHVGGGDRCAQTLGERAQLAQAPERRPRRRPTARAALRRRAAQPPRRASGAPVRRAPARYRGQARPPRPWVRRARRPAPRGRPGRWGA